MERNFNLKYYPIQFFPLLISIINNQNLFPNNEGNSVKMVMLLHNNVLSLERCEGT